MGARSNDIASLLVEEQDSIQQQWADGLVADGSLSGGLLTQHELRELCSRFLGELSEALNSGANAKDFAAPEWSGVRHFLDEFSSARALQGFRPSETAIFLFSLKEPVFGRLTNRLESDDEQLANEIWTASMLLDRLGLYTTEVYQKSREEVIARQQAELLELSTPVVELSPKILALPLIGTLDSNRTQVVMENLLQAIVEKGAEIAIIDISGVPTVDTLVAQHLIKTISAARLMGADCIISGIRPQIAQTIVHLGLEFDVISKAKLADAFALALTRIGQGITKR